MAKPPERDLLKILFTNFINSFRPRQFRGNLIGKDYFGNKYFEIPVNKVSSRTRPSRWFEPPEKEDFQQELPAEWEAWLRGRRKEPPTEEEINKNVAIMQIKKVNAAKIDAKSGTPSVPEKGLQSFPQLPEYERAPGDKMK